MLIELLQVEHIRNLESISLTPSPGINIFTGPNASGKTAILESIYFLSRSRSFRTTRAMDVLQHGADAMQVTAKVCNASSEIINTGIRKSSKKGSIRFNGKTVNIVSEQAKNIPVLIVTPDSYVLVSGSPKQRRHWLDWAMFHVEPDYLEDWKNYHKTLRQRNAALRSNTELRGTQILTWEKNLEKNALNLSRTRKYFINNLQEELDKLENELFPESPQLEVQDGWPEDLGFIESLDKSRHTDFQSGYTRYGPHRADIQFMIKGREISKICSRGQIKLFIYLLLIAQARVFSKRLGDPPILLIDDFAAELDLNLRKYLISLINNEKFQVFMTTTEADHITKQILPAGMFHVEHGNVLKVVK